MALSKEWAKVLIQSLEQSGLVGTVRTVWRPAGPIGGSETGQVVVCDATTVNFYNVFDAALSESPI